MLMEIAALNGASAAAIDSNRLEDWPGFFLDHCLYKITSADNFEKGYQAGLIYADSRAMLADRVLALREANIAHYWGGRWPCRGGDLFCGDPHDARRPYDGIRGRGLPRQGAA